ncbi:MAG TPA: BTAD domain-containing putative transcriptional regulator [Actinophytocola sp.]|uniref:AfsR/SARP family transcriptional regulator n=1 Tax=Actinophytocola sp. TaxID=1872138 RepID=UPI002DC055F3|nr:BTAD domain-containing putative transcriptional regulator [Actinophytocola sp.]HEU5470176.1 BTAD domain-containing putative transcriptional regulator [Actinophytocola sp.]
MEILVLGPLLVTCAGMPVYLRTGRKPRLVLAVLVSRAGQTVSSDALVAAVWGDWPAKSARRNLQQYIQQLRAAVGADRLVRRGDGYSVVADDGVDTVCFRRLCAAGDAALTGGDAELASQTLRAGLDLWRGPAFAEFLDCPAVAHEATNLEQLRLDAYERWAQAELALSRHSSIVTELAELMREHPYRESLCARLMLALYHSGRQAEALDAFHQTRVVLYDQLGIEAGPELRRLHEAMLRGDDDPGSTARPGPGPARSRIPQELPPEVHGFTGRIRVLRELDAMLPTGSTVRAGPVVIAAIVGTAGVGKTALAVHWAHRVADRFPDGQLYLDLRGHAPGRPLGPGEALTTLLEALGIPPQQVPIDVAAAAARFRSLLAGRRTLIVLDNAGSAAQVRPLLPAGPGSLVLITSRDRLTGLVAHDGARQVPLDVLNPAESAELLGHLLGAERVVAEPAATTELARRCSHLPLALRIAGAVLADQPHRTVAGFAADLSARDPLATLAIDADITVRSAFDLSYRTMPEPAQRMFRCFGLVPLADFTVSAAAMLAGSTDPEARLALDKLATAHLVVQSGADRYTMHDLLRQYAANNAAAEDSPARRAAAVHRLYDWLVTMSTAATSLLYPEALRLPPPPGAPVTVSGLTSTGSALAWLDAERHNLVAAIHHAARHGPLRAAWQCADALRLYHTRRRNLTDWLSTSRAAVAAARAGGDPHAQASAYLGLAQAHFCLGHYRRSTTYLRRTLKLTAEIGWTSAEAAVSSNLGIALHLQGHTTESIEHLRHAVHIHQRIDWPMGRARAMHILADAYRDVGRLDEGCALALRARALYQDGRTRRGEALATATLGQLYALTGQLDDAAHLLDSALTIFHEFGNRYREVHCHTWLARIHRDTGRLDEANESAQSALEMADQIGEPRLQAIARHTLGLVHETCADYTRAIRLHQAALTIAEQAGLCHAAGESLLGLATAHHANGDHQAAIDHATQSLALARRAGYAVIEGRTLTALGRLHYDLGDTPRALDQAQGALTNHRQTGHRLGEADTHTLLEKILHHLGDHSAADRHGRTARSLTDFACVDSSTRRTE